VKVWLRERLWYAVQFRMRSVRAWLWKLRRRGRISRKEADELYPEARKCGHCGGWHEHACPRVKAIVFRGDTPVRVEFWSWAEWRYNARREVIFPWQKAALIDDSLLEGELINPP